MFSRDRAPASIGCILVLVATSLAVVAGLSGCSADEGAGGSGAVSADGAALDGGSSDGGSTDAASTDGASTDAGSTDGTSTDVTSTAAGSGDAGGPTGLVLSDKIAVAGVWQSNFGGNETIGDQGWAAATGNVEIVEFDNDGRWAITRNPASARYNPGKYNKVVWTAPEEVAEGGWKGEAFHYCWIDFGLPSAELAKATTRTADASNPDKSGCGGFSWTKLSSIETAGTWKTNFGGVETIGTGAWASAWLRSFDNDKNTAITQNPADAKHGAGTFSKVVWTEAAGGKWYYCIVDYGLPTLEAAGESTKTAGSADPAEKGCGGFSWTEMSAM